MVRVSILASGSRGNSYFVSDGSTRLLVDAGISGPSLASSLRAIGENGRAIDAVLITHEHGDHVGGLCSFVDKYQPVVYLTRGTQDALKVQLDSVAARRVVIEPEAVFTVGSIHAFPMTVPHDAAQPVGYTVLAGGARLAFVADIGHITQSMAYAINDVDFLYLESNHDVDMLDCGPYPPRLRARVFVNHLSNAKVAKFIEDSMQPQVERLVLGHISGSNNSLSLVHSVAGNALGRRGLTAALHVCAGGMQPPIFSF